MIERCLEVPRVMRPFFAGKKRYRVAHGGRGGVKSWTVARMLLVRACERKLLILCAREFQKSIRDSVHRLLCNQISLLGLDAWYTVKETCIVNKVTGSEFIFAGLHHNITSLKSLEGVDIVWVEEAETISEDSWEKLDPTIRKPGSEIWVVFNPKLETDPTYVRFVKDQPENAVVVQTGWKDNPWLPEELRIQAEHMKRTDFERYEHVWGGKLWFKNDAQVLHGKWSTYDFEVQSHWLGPYLGADWGFSQDPTAMIETFVEVLNPEDLNKTFTTESGEEAPMPLRRNLYITQEAYAHGCEIMDLPALADQIPNFRKYPSKADNARPETISHLVHVGGFVLMESCEKWSGCVEDGVTYLRGFEHIFIHESCPRMIEEARLWSFKVDPLSGKILRQLKPGYDHGWDAVRYAHEVMITRTPTMFDVL